MINSNASIKDEVERKQRLYKALRRSDIVMQIRKKMQEKKIKNIDLASRIGVSEANVCRWLKGTQNLQLDTLYLLADALQESLSLQIGHEDVNTSDILTPQTDSADACTWRVSDAASWGNVVHIHAYLNIRDIQTELKQDIQTENLECLNDGDSYELTETAA